MIEGLKAYESKRSTGVFWLPEVPSHWEVRRSKHVFAERTELARAGDVQLSATQAWGVIPQAEFERRVGRRVVRISMHLDKRSHVEKGDFVISMRSFQGGLERAWASGAIRSSYVVLRPARELDLGYFTHLFKAQPYIKALQATGNFIRDGQDLTFGNFSRVDLPVPPHDEQIAIGRFLDHANHRIDQFIRSKKRLVALLNEQKQAIIHRAVTRGLDPNVKLKDSGVPSLGLVPAHWETTRVKAVFSCLNHRRVPLNAPERGEMKRREYDYYGASGIIDKVDDYVFDDDLLLIAEDGANLVLRNLPLSIIARGKFWVNNHAHILKPRNGSLEYLANYMETLNYRPWITGAAQPKLTKERLMSIAICVAPTVEQLEIDAHVDLATAPLNVALETANRELALLREYRTRLIADVVTGQLDVRAAAASLPDLDLDATAMEPPDDEDDAPEDVE